MLDITHDYFTGKTVIRTARLHRGPSEDAVVTLLNNGVAATLEGDAVMKLVAKPKGKRDGAGGARLIFVTIDSGDYHSNSGTYRKTFTTITDPIDDLFKVDADATNDVDEATVDANVVYIPQGGGEKPGDTFDLVIENTTYNPDDASPGSTVTPDDEWVAHGHSQTLTEEAKERARGNIGAVGTSDIDEAWTFLNALGIQYDAALGGLTIDLPLPGGGTAFIPLTTVPNP